MPIVPDQISLSTLFPGSSHVSVSVRAYPDASVRHRAAWPVLLVALLAVLAFASQARAVKTIATGTFHTCAILVDDNVRCWGNNEYGQLGYGNTYNIGGGPMTTPDKSGPVKLGTGRVATQLALGRFHTCAILDDGNVRCWGRSNYGQLGYGNMTDIGDNETPDAVGTVNLGAGRTAKQIAAGEEFTCALLDNDSVVCWGRSNYGQLGYGNKTTIGDNEAPTTGGPVNLGPGLKATAIAAGSYHVCAVLDTGAVRCWGSGTAGMLGYGNENDIGDNETPNTVGPVSLGAGLKATDVVAGANSTCALLDNGSVRCWGFNDRGQLGYGNTDSIGDNETPDTAGPVSLGAGLTVTQLSMGTGGVHACALLSNGTVRCWGQGFYGPLGYGSTLNIGDNETPDTAGPVNLGTGHTATQISAGGGHTCAIRDDEALRCWGMGTYGQLGYGDTVNWGQTSTPNNAGKIKLGEDPVLGLTSASSDLGTRTVGTTGTPVTVTVKNTGLLSFKGTIVLAGTDPGQFTLAAGDGTNGTCGTSAVIARDASCTVTINHTPTSAGKHSTSLDLSGNATASEAFTATGTAVPEVKGPDTPAPNTQAPSTPAPSTSAPGTQAPSTVTPLWSVTPLVRLTPTTTPGATTAGLSFTITTRTKGRITVFVTGGPRGTHVRLARKSIVCTRTTTRTLYAPAFVTPDVTRTCRVSLRFLKTPPAHARLRIVIGVAGKPLANMIEPTPVRR